VWSLRAKSTNGLFDQGALEVTCVQNSRNRSTREWGVLPAIMTPLMAPIEMPAIQSGLDIGFRQGLVDASLLCPQRTAALQQQGNALERELSSHRPDVWPNLEIHCVSLFDDF
jgi:hypothetical protein